MFARVQQEFQISTLLPLIFAKYPIGQLVDITQGQRNTRIAVISYADQAVINANFTDINSISDLSKVLNSLTASTSPVADLYE